MAPYIVQPGREVYDAVKPYKAGTFMPGSKGELDDLEEDGAVKWVETAKREPVAKPKAVKSHGR